MKDGGHLGACIDFDYLGDDDDDDATGGAPAPEFNAVPLITRPLGAFGSNIAFTVTTTVTGGAQTSAEFGVLILSEHESVIDAVIEDDLVGWTSSGWTDLGGGTWEAYFTSASVTAGQTLEFHIQSGLYDLPHTLTITTSSPVDPTPNTDQASGSGATDSVDVE